MRRFSVNLKLEENGDCWSRTLMITNIPRRNSDINDMDRHFKSVFLLLLVFSLLMQTVKYYVSVYIQLIFREAYPECEVENIQLAYDVNKANELDRDRYIIIQIVK